MDLNPLIDAAEQRQAAAERDAQGKWSTEETRLRLNGEKVEATLRQEALPVLLDAARQLNERGYKADVSSIKSELQSPVGIPLALQLDFKFASDKVETLFRCSLIYRGDCHSAVITPEFKVPTGHASPDPTIARTLSLREFTRTVVEEHVERLVECAFFGKLTAGFICSSPATSR